MRSAPPVSLIIGPDRPVLIMRRLAAALAVLLVLLWLGSHGAAAWAGAPNATVAWFVEHLSAQTAVGAAAIALCLWVAWRQPSARHGLQWDGQVWWLAAPDDPQRGAPRAGSVQVAVDLQRWLLLRFIPAESRRPAQWLMLSRQDLAADWHALRCALYAPRPAGPALQAPPP